MKYMMLHSYSHSGVVVGLLSRLFLRPLQLPLLSLHHRLNVCLEYRGARTFSSSAAHPRVLVRLILALTRGTASPRFRVRRRRQQSRRYARGLHTRMIQGGRPSPDQPRCKRRSGPLSLESQENVEEAVDQTGFRHYAVWRDTLMRQGTALPDRGWIRSLCWLRMGIQKNTTPFSQAMDRGRTVDTGSTSHPGAWSKENP